jgi:hypothetical protein
LLSNLLGKRRFNKAAGILSGGEVLFGVMLPRCKEVIAVDHSYGSLAAAYMKAILLDMLGVKALKELFIEGSYDQLFPHLKAAVVHMPHELTKYVNILEKQSGGYYGSSLFANDLIGLRREWFYMKDSTLERARRRLDKVIVIHGDLMDLGNFGQFELLYISNAMEHANRNAKTPQLLEMAKLVTGDGLLLTTSNGGPVKTNTQEWELVKSIRGFRTSWSHNLYKRL